MSRPQIILPDNSALDAIKEFQEEFPGAKGQIAKDAILAGLPKLRAAELAKKEVLETQ